MASSTFGSEKKSISSQVPKSQKLMASSSLSEKSFPCQLRMEYGTWAAAEAAKKIKNLWVIVCIYGYESSLPEDDETGKALVNHFGSICGRTRDFMFGKDPFNPEQGRCAYIEVWGKEALEKAVALTGTEVAGLKILVKPAPTYQEIYKNLPFDALSFGSTTVPVPAFRPVLGKSVPAHMSNRISDVCQFLMVVNCSTRLLREMHLSGMR